MQKGRQMVICVKVKPDNVFSSLRLAIIKNIGTIKSTGGTMYVTSKSRPIVSRPQKGSLAKA